VFSACQQMMNSLHIETILFTLWCIERSRERAAKKDLGQNYKVVGKIEIMQIRKLIVNDTGQCIEATVA
jgi:hypothetical protein